jgi:hypothetical protein
MEDRKVLDSYSESEIEEAFLAVFDEKAKYNYITSYDIDVNRDYDDDQKMKIVVQIGSMAGAPTKDDFSNVEGMDRFEITFTTGAKTTVAVCEVLDINTMEYHVLYAEASGDELDTPVIDSVSPEDITSLSGSSELEDSEPADEELPEEGGDE